MGDTVFYDFAMKKIYIKLLRLTICFLIILGMPACSVADDNTTVDDAKKEIESEVTIESAININIKDCMVTSFGSEIIPDGISGAALRLPKEAYLTIESEKLINQKSGTIIFWVRPHWNYYDRVGETLTSHTFISFEWDEPKRGYFAISDGWWEPAGSLKTYFVFDNQQYVHTSKVHKYLKDYWVQMACTWDVKAGIVRLYIDGQQISESRRPFTSPSKPKTIFIGCDKGTTMSNNRWADCDIDEISFYDKALAPKTITKHCRQYDPDPQARYLAYLKNELSSVKKSQHDPARRQIRAIFDEGTGWMTPSGAQKTIERIKKAGFNVYVPCVWHGRGTRYPSAVAPPEEKADFREGDPLARVIKIAHENGIEVHPWFCVALRQRDFLQNYYATETPQNAFDLQRPEFRKFITDTIVDVVRRYNVDGVNLDYIRTMGICRCNYCQQAYKKRFGRNLLNDIHRKGPRNELYIHVQEWQDNAVEEIVQRVSINSKQIRQSLINSVCGNPIPSFFPPSPEGRNEITWANTDLVDIVYNMDYTAAPDFEYFGLAIDEFEDPHKLLFLLGNYEHVHDVNIPRKALLLSGIINYVQSRWGNGIAIYLYSLLSDDQIAILRQSSTKSPDKPTLDSEQHLQ